MEIPEEDVRELKALMKEARVDTYKELFSNALTLLYWAVRQVKDGRVIASLNEKEATYKELSMPVLDRIKQPRSPAETASVR